MTVKAKAITWASKRILNKGLPSTHSLMVDAYKAGHRQGHITGLKNRDGCFKTPKEYAQLRNQRNQVSNASN